MNAVLINQHMMHEQNRAFKIWGIYILRGICPGDIIYMSQGVSDQGVSVRGVYNVLGVSVRGEHVRGGGGGCPVTTHTTSYRKLFGTKHAQPPCVGL